MIAVDLPARMTCEEKDCAESVPVQLALLGMGGFGFRPPAGAKWQVLLNQGNPGAPFACYCPAHAKIIEQVPGAPLPKGLQVGPSGPRMMNGRRR